MLKVEGGKVGELVVELGVTMDWERYGLAIGVMVGWLEGHGIVDGVSLRLVRDDDGAGVTGAWVSASSVSVVMASTVGVVPFSFGNGELTDSMTSSWMDACLLLAGASTSLVVALEEALLDEERVFILSNYDNCEVSKMIFCCNMTLLFFVLLSTHLHKLVHFICHWFVYFSAYLHYINTI